MTKIKIDAIYKWIMDTNERNAEFRALVTQIEPDKWIMKKLKLSFFVILKQDVKDQDCADMTNENADGMIELKSYGDFVGSTTGDGSHHLEEQAIKMYATGIPSAIVIYGSRFAFENESRVDQKLILQAHQKLMTIQAVYKIPVHFIENPSEAIEVSKTFIRQCNGFPRRLPIYSLLKREGPIAVLVGYNQVGETTAWKIYKAWHSLDNFFKFIHDNKQNYSNEELSLTVRDKTPGLNIRQARSIVNTTFKQI